MADSIGRSMAKYTRENDDFCPMTRFAAAAVPPKPQKSDSNLTRQAPGVALQSWNTSLQHPTGEDLKLDNVADRNLLFGILAVQLDYVRSQHFMDAANQWMLQKQTSIGEILVAKGVLAAADCDFLNTIVDKQIARSGSPQKSLEHIQATSAEMSDLTSANGIRTALNSATAHKADSEELTIALPPAGDISIIGQRFNLIRELARGGLGELFVAMDRELDREVAVKKIIEERRSSQDILDRFLAEAKITGGLEHPGIVPVYGLGTFSSGAPFYVMRLIRGQSLHDAIRSYHKRKEKRKDKVDEDRVLRNLIRAVIDACNAVGYANSRGVIHRDIKPQNIMMGKYGETLVVDWGLAKVKGVQDTAFQPSEPPLDDARQSDSAPTAMGSVMGTYAFMSPEQANGRIDLIDRRSDVFSLGATLYAVITNRAPFKEDNRHESLAAAKSCTFKRPSELNPRVSKSLEAICLKAMSKEREERYDSATELAEDLDNWIAGAPVKAHPERLFQRTMRFARKNQTAVASVFVTLCVASVALLLSNFAISRERNTALFERDRANLLTEQAEAANERKEQSNKVAISILDQFVKNIVGDQWANVPNMDQERLDMYELALGGFKDLLQLSPDDALVKKNVIQLYVRSADVYRHRGNDEEANKRADAALRLAEEVIASSNGDIALLHLLTDCSRDVAQNKLATLGPIQALRFAEKSKQIAIERARADRGVMAQLALGIARVLYSEICREAGQAVLAFDEGKLASILLRAHNPSKSKPYFQTIYLASALNATSLAQIDLGDFVGAMASAQEANQLTAKGMSDFKDIVDLKTVFAESSLIIANIERKTKALANADTSAQKALETIEGLCVISPANINYRRLKGVAWQSACLIALDRNEKATALEAAEKSQAALDAVFVDQPINAQTLPVQLLTHAAHYAALDPDSQKEKRAQLKEVALAELTKLRSANPNHPDLPQLAELLTD